jgi:spermidine/putrescine transport system substrate-binding protein
MAAVLAACSSPGASSSGSTPPAALPPLAHELTVAQWPLYMDRAKGGHRPTLEAFEAQYDVDVTYREIINDNQEFFAKLAPQLQAHQSTGWDLVALSDWVVTRLNRAGWIEPLHFDHLPNVDANLLPAFRDPVYDPGNAHSVPWQGGITGIAYNPKQTGFPLGRFADLWDPRLAGHVGMLTEMVDTMSLTLLMLGVDPQEATLDDAEKAQQKLIEQRDAGIVRKYFGQDYIDAIVDGDTWATMAWSGDVFYWKYVNGADLAFVVPEEGGMIWVTPLEIPEEAQHPTDAHAFIDWYYRPDIAVQVTDWVLYMTPVKGVRELMVQKAEQAKDDATKRYYETLSQSPMLFPPDDLASANLHEYKALSEAEYQRYSELFSQVTEG